MEIFIDNESGIKYTVKYVSPPENENQQDEDIKPKIERKLIQNIKQEPEAQFELILPSPDQDDPEIVGKGLKKLNQSLDSQWTTKADLSEFDYVSKLYEVRKILKSITLISNSSNISYFMSCFGSYFSF